MSVVAELSSATGSSEGRFPHNLHIVLYLSRETRGDMGMGAGDGDAVMGEAEVAPARKRPKRIAGAKKTASAAERFKAATAKPAGKGGVVMVQESAEEKAQALYQFLIEQGAIK